MSATSPRPGWTFAELPGALWALFLVGAGFGLLTSNPLLTATSILLLPLYMLLLWRPGETPILLFIVSFQWLQVASKVFHADVLGADVTEFSKYAYVDLPSIEQAIWLSLVGLVVLALGMHVVLRRLGAADQEKGQHEVQAFSADRAFILYLVCTVVAAVLQANAWSFGGLVQLVRAAVSIKWVGFFILGYVVLKQRNRYALFAAAVFMEFVAGIGFFSGFKTVLFVTLIVVFTVWYRLRPKTVVWSVGLLAVLLVLGAGWTSIKGEYRAYLNQGTGAQATLVSRSDQFSKLGELVGELEREDLAIAMGELFERVSYVDYFALSIDYVPDVAPHAGGALWKQSVLHMITPRALFPDKPSLPSDSELTMQFTGLQLASDSDGTSISIGYMGESYIDFGPIGMFAPIFLLGLFLGGVYYYFVSRARYTLVGYAFATALLLNAYQFEMAGIKLIGGLVTSFVVLALMMFAVERWMGSWLQGGNAAADRRPASRRVGA